MADLGLVVAAALEVFALVFFTGATLHFLKRETPRRTRGSWRALSPRWPPSPSSPSGTTFLETDLNCWSTPFLVHQPDVVGGLSLAELGGAHPAPLTQTQTWGTLLLAAVLVSTTTGPSSPTTDHFSRAPPH